ncbi:MAG: integrase [Candidatus Nitrosocosmicus sp.]
MACGSEDLGNSNTTKVFGIGYADNMHFKEYLQSQNLKHKTVNDLYRYAIQYKHVLSENPSELSTYPNSKRRHIMRALAAYSKFTGQYNRWQTIRKQYQFKWSATDSLTGFHNILKQNGDFTKMIEWVTKTMKSHPRFANILMFNVLVGLRPQEAIDSFNLLLSDKREEYLSKDEKLLEHFKFPDIFLRRTKKAFISISSAELVSLVENQKPLTYDTIKKAITRKEQTGFRMSFCRKIFATFLRNEGVELELIDLLQGRIPDSVFVRHYYRPAMSRFDEIRVRLCKLHKMMIEG